MKRILVTGAGGAASYNFIKSLQEFTQSDFTIIGADCSKFHLELAPPEKKYILPVVSDPSYLEKLQKLIDKEKIDFVHPQPDVEVCFLAKHREKLAAKMLLPSYTTIQKCQDKMQLFSILNKDNVSIPESYHVTSIHSLAESLNKILQTNEKAWIRAIHGAGSKAALPIKTFDHARMWIEYWKDMKGLVYSDFMVSEYLPGKEYAFQSFWMNGKLIVSQARERVEYLFGNIMPSGQTSTPSVAVTVNNDEINKTASDAIISVDPHATGIFCVDLKTNKNGEICVTEINAGRFFTTSYFFSQAGVNMPYIYTKYGVSEELKKTWKQYNNIASDMYWVRMVDMGYKLVKDNKWTSIKI